MKIKKSLCTIMAIICIVSCFAIPASAIEVDDAPAIEATEQVLDVDVVVGGPALRTLYTEDISEYFKIVYITNKSSHTLTVKIGTYETTVQPGYKTTLTYTSYAWRLIELSSTYALNYTISYD